MNLYDQVRAQKLIRLAREHFDPSLKDAELTVLRASADSTPPLSIPPKNIPRLEVRAEFLRWLVTDPEARPYIDAIGLRVLACTIIGDLRLNECRNLPSLWLLRCEIKGKVTLQGAETSGVYFMNSHIEGGISAARVVVHGPVYLEEFSSPREIRLLGAQIEDQLIFTGAKLTGPEAENKSDDSPAPVDSLVLDGARIGGDALFNQKFECAGRLRLLGASIGGQLNFMGATVAAVYCNDLQLEGELLWCGVSKTQNTELHLTGARVRTLSDDSASWPEEGKLDLLGLVYDDLILHAKQTPEQQLSKENGNPQPLLAAERVEWLRLQGLNRSTQPQPWMQLRSHLETKGDKAGAKHVVYKLNRLRAGQSEWHPWQTLGRSAHKTGAASQSQTIKEERGPTAWSSLRHPNRSWAIAFAWLEERPSRILYSIVLTLLLGTLIFAEAGPSRSGAMIPTARDANGRPLSGNALAYYPRYQPFIYTLENALPLVKLGMDDKWAPDPYHDGQALFPQYRWLDWLGWFNSYWFLTVSRWLLILSGWFQATVLAATLVNRFK
jgi:hypothetical protein